MDNDGLALVSPAVQPELDPDFRPAALATRSFRERVLAVPDRVPVRLALEQPGSAVFHFGTEVFPEHHSGAKGNFAYLERWLKFLLWSRGAARIYFAGPADLAGRLQARFRDTPAGRFDSELVGERIFGRSIEIIHVDTGLLPAERIPVLAPGRHLNGCRIGFDLGGSDRKVAAVIDGKVAFSDETAWDPYPQSDPQYHFDGIMDSLRKAAAHLPRVDAIGGSAAGVYVGNRVKVASLFRGVSPELFRRRVADLFFEIQRAWGGVPVEVLNDGEVTALAGAMWLGKTALLGIALGTSVAAGYVTREGCLTSWLNELAFVPVDFNPHAQCDEWSGDYGVGVQYLSQQAVGRLSKAAGIASENRTAAEQLRHVQDLLAMRDPRAAGVYKTIGTYLGYSIAHFAEFYDFDHVLVLGRVMTGSGGETILACAGEALAREFPLLGRRISFHTPDETTRRHGQAIAAASLPEVGGG